MNFYAAYIVCAAAMGALISQFIHGRLERCPRIYSVALVLGLLVIPTTAVIFQEHTGLIYSLEILAGLFGLNRFSWHVRVSAIWFVTLRRQRQPQAQLRRRKRPWSNKMTTIQKLGQMSWLISRQMGLTALLTIGLVALSHAAGPQSRATGASAESSATLSLDTVLNLYRENEEMKEQRPSAPPVPAVVQSIEIEGRILDEGVLLDTRIVVEVLADDEWVSVPLFDIDDDTVLQKVPDVRHGAVANMAGQLRLVTNKKGRFDLKLRLLKRAKADGDNRRAAFKYSRATFATFRVNFDAELFSLLSESEPAGADGYLIYPLHNEFSVDWRRRANVAVEPAEVLAKPELEPVIPTATASLVSTLEGEYLLRVHYDLQFDGREPISFELPEGQSLVRAYLNRVVVPVEADGRTIRLDVEPVQAGQTGGELELIVASRGNGYLLSGERSIELPSASWRTNELYLTAHLPTVFEYAWSNGTLSPVEHAPKVKYVYDIPTPGRRLTFKQFLVHESTPLVNLGYDVSLDGHYFKAGAVQ